MNVALSCAGRFHAFHLAEQLYRRSALASFTTTTLNARLIPNRELPPALAGDPAFLKLVREIPLPEYLCYLLRKIPGEESQSRAYLVKDNLFDREAAKFVGKSDVFTGWANQSLFQLREAKTRGAVTIIERGSTHITYQQRLIEEERKKLGIQPIHRSKTDKMLEEKQLKEYHEADYIMVPSEFARKSFVEMGWSAVKILKTPYGVDLDRFHPDENKTSSASSVFKLLFVGPIGAQKGIRYLLEAVDLLKRDGRSIELTVIGQVEDDFKGWFSSSPLRSLITRHITYLPNRELLSHFHAADLYVHPSMQEGLALVIAEAMGSGLPVVATENSGAAEFVRDGIDGYVIQAGASTAIAEKISNLIEDRASLEQMAHSAAEHIRQFSWDAYGERIFEIYSGLIAQRDAAKASATGDEISSYYDEYWDKEKGWTPSHSFSDEQLDIHFKGAFTSDAAVLDVGCGDASNYQSWLVKQVGKLSAIDISKTGIARATQMGIDAHIHDLSQKFPYAENSFDGATCIEVLEHLYDPKFCVSEIFRVLKPGGLLVCSVPNNGYFRERLKAFTRAEMSTSITDFANEWKGAHIRFYSLKSFSRMLEVTGFNVESVRSNRDSSIFDGFDAIGGYTTQQVTTALRHKLPRALRLAFLEDIIPSIFAPHIIVWARKPGGQKNS